VLEYCQPDQKSNIYDYKCDTSNEDDFVKLLIQLSRRKELRIFLLMQQEETRGTCILGSFVYTQDE